MKLRRDKAGRPAPDLGVGAGASLEQAREAAVDLLAECFAQDRLTLPDFEQQVSLVHNARSRAELEEIVAELQGGGTPAKTSAKADIPASTFSVNSEARRPHPTAPSPTGTAPVATGGIRPSDRAVAIFGETKRTGAWTPAYYTVSAAVMGSVLLDLREALLGPGETVFQVYAVLGSVEVVVQPGQRVECNGSAVLGSFEQGVEAAGVPLSDGPVIRVDGLSVLGSVEVHYRYVGESKRQAKKRRKMEKKQRRALRR